jgi:oligoendopeptidase F
MSMEIKKPKREFISENLKIDSWESIKEYYQNLLARKISTLEDFEKWLIDRSELDAVMEENAAWRYIKMTIDTSNEELTKDYTFFVSEIQPKASPYEDLLNKKMVEYDFFEELKSNQAYSIYFRSIATSLALYREKNIPLEAEINEKSQIFGAISGAQTIEHLGEQITMQKASSLLKDPDGELRKQIFLKIATRRKDDIFELDNLYSDLVAMRHEVAINAGFKNYRDYMFQALGRFDYTKENCFEFHTTVKKSIIPLIKKIHQKRLDQLGINKFKPWDTEVDPLGRGPLHPFIDGKDLLEKTQKVFQKMDPYFADCLKTMDLMGYLDLDSKKGKAPGGYNYPLYEIGVPFIFMNAVGSQKDLVTMVHEGGHAIHSFLTRDLKLTGFKNLPSEVAELASMSMELLSMKYWDVFYDNPVELKRAIQDQLESVITILPWIAQVDEFQHWVYENPTHTINERKIKWVQLSEAYSTGLVDWEEYEDIRTYSWQKQMHLFEVPFYYIEYGIAQLGALSIWKNSIDNEENALNSYKNALKLGYTQSIPNIYKTAGVSFDFSETYISSVMDFVSKELEINAL